MTMRRSIFLSHAAPEDNDFVRWLGIKLELAGYEVWYDLARLKGGDYFWDKIEVAIREDAYRFVAVLSKIAITKRGVKDECGLAATIEGGFPGFVIPIRVDDVKHGDFPISLHNKNAIDFSRGWHKGLASLIDTLEEAETPKVAIPDPSLVRHWLPEQQDGAIARRVAREHLDSSWLRIVSLPPTIENARILGTDRKIKETSENRVYPWFEHEDRIVGFAKAADLVSLMANTVMLQATKDAVDTGTFVESGSTLGKERVPKAEARKRVSNLVRQAWELALESKGFASAQQAGGKAVFYATPELTGGRGKKLTYEDYDGRKRRKALNGRSETRGTFCWAFGVGIVPSLYYPWRVELRSVVVFTDDDGNIIEPKRAHRLRRGFCRNWWNEHWRTLSRAFLWLLADGQPEIHLPVGSGRSVVLSTAPIQFEAPVGLSDVELVEDAEPVDDGSDDADDEFDAEEDDAEEAAQ